MAQITIHEYYQLKLDDDKYLSLPQDDITFLVNDEYQKEIFVGDQKLQSLLGIEGRVIGFKNGDDLDYRSENLLLTPPVIEEVVESEIKEEATIEVQKEKQEVETEVVEESETKEEQDIVEEVEESTDSNKKSK